LYGLKQIPREWYAKMESYLISKVFIRCISYPNVYMMRNIYSIIFIFLYVDDLLITGISTSIFVVKTALQDRFSMTDMRLLHYFMDLEINQNDLGINIS